VRKAERNGQTAPAKLPFPAAEATARLLLWYGACGRNLPWRNTRDPYRIWLSEIMLQQTGVDAVIPYYRRFLEAYPDVAALAAAPVEEVIERWAGLGYYRRARNLHAAAAAVVARFAGRFPDDAADLQGLPGVGRSTAGAIMALAFDRAEPILDGNVRRVLCRLCAYADDPRTAAAERQLWFWSQALVSRDHPHDYTQAVMDLGATLCTPRRPRCSECPLQGLCLADVRGLAEQLPARTKGKKTPQRRQVALVIERDGRVLVCRRGLDGMLGGLWEFPTRAVADGESADEAAAALATDHAAKDPGLLGGVRHVYSHFRLELTVYAVRSSGVDRVAENSDCRWLTSEELAETALHGAHKKALPLLAAGKERA